MCAGALQRILTDFSPRFPSAYEKTVRRWIPGPPNGAPEVEVRVGPPAIRRETRGQ